ncbi:hypothetical protein [Ramlibacter rhizophilus]|uniref:Uncharacterized protein n=1 Tax=Ramlibacter rhizophilus TaxID=1781167 RepID=A0A4Z0BV66_9BURK|nr:hypothetical protein [Ramlibacter rhizophilus]TFZ03206.1 hypothetical protein EZ242_04775 [Ramlibacter rhizophilus]
MPTPNYGYEKRQKELAKKRKKEDKLRAKAERKSGQGPADEQTPSEQGEEGDGSAQNFPSTRDASASS